MTDTADPQTTTQAHDTSDQQAPIGGEPTAQPDDIAPPLAGLIASIRAAVTRSASAEARVAGATACRSILTVLEAKPGQPLAAAPAPAASPSSPVSPIAALLAQPGFLSKLATMSRDELINVLRQITGAIALPTQTPTTAAPRFHLIQIPVVGRKGGGS